MPGIELRKGETQAFHLLTWRYMSAFKGLCGRVKGLLANGKANRRAQVAGNPRGLIQNQTVVPKAETTVFLAKTVMNSVRMHNFFPEFRNLYII